tara:strand:+ start:13470 stop:14048 length:579 start_codon:yes stop_codon:yes gene_type:complete
MSSPIRVDTYKVRTNRGAYRPKSEQQAFEMLTEIESVVSGRDWFIPLEMVTEKHDKFYIVGWCTNEGYYISYGRNGHVGKVCPHKSLKSLAYKLSEKIQKGYTLNTTNERFDACKTPRVFPIESYKAYIGAGVPTLDDGGRHEVDLTGVSTMFKVISAIRYAGGVYKGYNERDEYVMSVPTPVIDAYVSGGA